MRARPWRASGVPATRVGNPLSCSPYRLNDLPDGAYYRRRPLNLDVVTAVGHDDLLGVLRQLRELRLMSTMQLRELVRLPS